MPVLRKLLLTPLILLLIGYVIALKNNVIMYYLYAHAVAYLIWFFLYSLLLRSVLRKFDPDIKNLSGRRKKLFLPVEIFCFLMFHAARQSISRYVKITILYYLTTFVFLCFSIFLAGTLLKPKKTKMIKAALFIMAFALYMFSFHLASMYSSAKIIFSNSEKLKSLPYLTWVSAKDSMQYSGVIKYDEKKAYKGLNFFNPRHTPVVRLMDMQGNVIHTWMPSINLEDGFQYAHLKNDGSVLLAAKEQYLVCCDWGSKIIWKRKARIHHDIRTTKDGDLYILSRREEMVWYDGLPMAILNDYIEVYSPNGEKKKEFSVFNLLKNIPEVTDCTRKHYHSSLIELLQPNLFLNTIKMKFIRKEGDFWFRENSAQDFFHTNSIQVIERDIPGLCKKNDILLSCRQLDLIAIVDMQNGRAIWWWGPGNLIDQHHATLLENNNILVFDNGDARKRHYSRVVELNPFTKTIPWEYKSDPPEKFYSSTRGACQRLPNGNTLITESDAGHVFEVTKEGETVWEFYTPELDVEKQERTAIYRFTRIVNPEEYPALTNLK